MAERFNRRRIIIIAAIRLLIVLPFWDAPAGSSAAANPLHSTR